MKIKLYKHLGEDFSPPQSENFYKKLNEDYTKNLRFFYIFEIFKVDNYFPLTLPITLFLWLSTEFSYNFFQIFLL